MNGGRALSGDRAASAGDAHERGSGTVLVLALVLVALAAGLVLAALASAQSARGAAQSAADLAALAGATAARDGWPACPVVTDAVERNGARVLVCTEEGGGVVRVDVTRDVGGIPGWSGGGPATASARAGPRTARGDPVP